MSGPEVVTPSGVPDFENPGNKKVEGDYVNVPSSGTPDFEKGGGQMTVRGPGEVDLRKVYETEKKSRTDNSYF